MAIDPISSGAIFSVLQNIQIQSTQIAQSQQRIATGFRVNFAADDPSGSVQINSLKTQINGFGAANRNNQSSISLLQATGSGLTQLQNVINDLQTQIIAAGAGGLTASQGAAISAQILQDVNNLGNLVLATKFNNQQLLTGSILTLQVGPDSGETVTVTLPNVTNTSIFAAANITVTAAGVATIVAAGALANLRTDLAAVPGTPVPAADITAALATITSMNTGLATATSTAASAQAGVQAMADVLTGMTTATQSALANIQNADVAAETVKLAKAQFQYQAGVAALALFNLQAASVLSLLRSI